MFVTLKTKQYLWKTNSFYHFWSIIGEKINEKQIMRSEPTHREKYDRKLLRQILDEGYK